MSAPILTMILNLITVSFLLTAAFYLRKANYYNNKTLRIRRGERPQPNGWQRVVWGDK